MQDLGHLGFSLQMLGRMIIGEVSLKNLSGPITSPITPASRRRLGWFRYLRFLALISISLGVLNLLPVPLLDGGHSNVLYFLSCSRARPVSDNAIEIGQRRRHGGSVRSDGFRLYNDIHRLIERLIDALV